MEQANKLALIKRVYPTLYLGKQKLEYCYFCSKGVEKRYMEEHNESLEHKLCVKDCGIPLSDNDILTGKIKYLKAYLKHLENIKFFVNTDIDEISEILKKS